MTIWIFGDTEKQFEWTNTGDPAQSLALNGSSLDFVYQRFNIARKKIEKNDTVVITLTDINRRWYFKNYPGAAESDRSPTGNKQENKAIDLYREYLDHKEIYDTYFVDFLYNLQAITEDLELKVILITTADTTENTLTDKKHLFPLFNFYTKDQIDSVKL